MILGPKISKFSNPEGNVQVLSPSKDIVSLVPKHFFASEWFCLRHLATLFCYLSCVWVVKVFLLNLKETPLLILLAGEQSLPLRLSHEGCQARGNGRQVELPKARESHGGT